MSVITVVGAGMMGSSIAIPAHENGNEIRLVGTHLDREVIRHARETGEHMNLRRQLPQGYRYYQFDELNDALDGADLLVGGVSSFGVDWFAKNVLSVIPDSLPVLSVTKGMHLLPDNTLITFPELYERMLPGRSLSLNAVGGPCTSYELADHDQTEVCFCGKDAAMLERIRSLFETSYYHISTSTDVAGVEVAVAMKNAYALAVCLAVGMSKKRNADGHENYNSQAALFGQSLREMQRLIAMYGGGEDKLALGAGDLYVTVFGGRTRRIGTLLGEGDTLQEALAKLQGVTLESIVIATRTAVAVRQLISDGKASERDFPLMLHVDAILNEGAHVDIPWNAFETHAD